MQTEPLDGSTRRRMERPVLDFPQPDSPTSASVSPRIRSKDRFSTACTRPLSRPIAPLRISNRVVRLRTFRIGASSWRTVASVRGGGSICPVCLSTLGNRNGSSLSPIEPNTGTDASKARVYGWLG
ncbi:hypothetical protein D3C85_1190780 [compost metagenome]